MEKYDKYLVDASLYGEVNKEKTISSGAIRNLKIHTPRKVIDEVMKVVQNKIVNFITYDNQMGYDVNHDLWLDFELDAKIILKKKP
jgi:hypothetical protein